MEDGASAADFILAKFQKKLHEFKKNIGIKPFKNNKNHKCKFVWYMRELLFYRYFDTVIFSRIPGNVEKSSKVRSANSSSIWGNEFLRIKKLQNVWKKISLKPFKSNKNRKYKFVRYMRGITFSMYKITRYICIIVAINDVNTTKIKGDLASGIWENKLL